VGDPKRHIEPWRDTGVVIEGPAVADLEQAFAETWVAAGAELQPRDLSNRGGQVQLTRDGATTWRDLDPGRSLPARPVNSLAFDPTNPNVLFAAFSL
jgi:phosphatidylserine/phosphatidylglycerophosphate/cardiolipin synthase-like enzyme